MPKKKTVYRRPGARYDDETGHEFLSWVVTLLDATSSHFTDNYTPEELLKIAVAQSGSGWDMYPDQWTPEQVSAALKYGESPKFCLSCEGPCRPFRGAKPIPQTEVICQRKVCRAHHLWEDYQQRVLPKPAKKETGT